MPVIARKCIIVTIACLFAMVIISLCSNQRFFSDGIVRLPINSNSTCSAPLRRDVGKVASYSFPAASDYENLFIGSAYTSGSVPDTPVLLSAFSSNHFEEGMTLLRNISGINTAMAMQLIIYDLGLSSSQVSQISKLCSCEVRPFPFKRYPSFVRELNSYTFKPLAIQMVAREHPFVIWLDTSVRFTTRNLQPLIDKARKYGVLCTRGGAPLAQRTHPATFKFLDERPCTFRSVPELQATAIVIYGTRFVRDNFLKPWVSCALSFGCLKPESNSYQFIFCNKHGAVYHDCHRFDQSVLGILLYRLYIDEIEEHFVHTDTLIIDRS